MEPDRVNSGRGEAGERQAVRVNYRVDWSDEDGEFVATVEQCPSLSWLDATPVGALNGLVQLIDDITGQDEK